MILQLNSHKQKSPENDEEHDVPSLSNSQKGQNILLYLQDHKPSSRNPTIQNYCGRACTVTKKIKEYARYTRNFALTWYISRLLLQQVELYSVTLSMLAKQAYNDLQTVSPPQQLV